MKFSTYDRFNESILGNPFAPMTSDEEQSDA